MQPQEFGALGDTQIDEDLGSTLDAPQLIVPQNAKKAAISYPMTDPWCWYIC